MTTAFNLIYSAVYAPLRHYVLTAFTLVVLSIFLSFAAIWLGWTTEGQALRELLSLPSIDYVAEASRLHDAGLLEDAAAVIDAGLDDDAIDAGTQEQLVALRTRVEADKASWLRRAKDAGAGFIFGTVDTPAGLTGATAADFVAYGDFRDIATETYRWYKGDDVDEVVLALAGVGAATTVTTWAGPQWDISLSLLKTARRLGSLSSKFVGVLIDLCKVATRTGALGKLKTLTGAVFDLAKSTSPLQAVRLLRYADGVDDVVKLAALAAKQKHASFVLQTLDRDFITALVRSSSTALDPGDSMLLLRLASKGKNAQSWLRTYQPHIRAVVGGARFFEHGRYRQAAEQAARWFGKKLWAAVVLSGLLSVALVGVLCRRIYTEFSRKQRQKGNS